MLETLSDYSGLLNLLIVFVFVPAFRFGKRIMKDMETMQAENKKLQQEFIKANKLLKEEISLLKTMLFKHLPPEEVREYVLKNQKLKESEND